MFKDEIDVALHDGFSEPSRTDILKNIDTSMYSEEQLKEQEQIVEAILFMMGDSVTVDVLSTALSKEHDIALAAAERLVGRYENEYKDRGMKIIRINHKYQMVANNKYFQNLVLVASKPQKPVLTDAVLETLSIIAYKQPITKPEIEVIRGVKSDFAVNRLIEYGLVEEKGRLEAPGRPILLGTTEEFLLRFGLESTEDLPILPPQREAEIQSEVEKELTESLGEPVHIDNDDVNTENADTNIEDSIEENKEENAEENKEESNDSLVNNDENKEEINDNKNADNDNDEEDNDNENEDDEDGDDNENEDNEEAVDEEELILEALKEDEEAKVEDKKEFNEVDKNLIDKYKDEENIIGDDSNFSDIENNDSTVSHERQDTQHDEKTESDDKEPQ